MEPGYIHIYCGDGKGKTSAATGLAVRAAGWGKKILFVRFLKNENSGERKVLSSIPGIKVLRPEKTYGLYSHLSEKEKGEAKATYREFWMQMRSEISEGNYDMLVLDEFMAAYNYGIISEGEALRFLKEKPVHLEIILTGRNPAPCIEELADYVSEIRKIKHPFDRGVHARKGIEY